MNYVKAATHVRKALDAATPGQLVHLGARKHHMNGAPNYTKAALNALRQAVREAGYLNINEAQSYISARTYAGMRQQKSIPRNSSYDRVYTGIDMLRDVDVQTVRAADIEAQGVFWVLVAGEHLDGATATYFLEKWVKAGLPLPKGAS